MEAPVFYAPPDALTDNVITLSTAESSHALKVMRLRKGDEVVVVDGCGVAYRGAVLEAKPKSKILVKVTNIARQFGEPVVHLTLAAALSTAAKFDVIVQKGTELGVSRFVPVISEKSKVRIEDEKKAAAKVKRLQKVALAAIKQCRRSLLPAIEPPTALSGLLKATDPDAVKLLFHPDPAAKPLSPDLFGAAQRRATILVGPESGFSRLEADAAVEAGFRLVTLGPRILRAETAGPVACALVMDRFGELS